MLFTRLRNKLLSPLSAQSRSDQTILGICLAIAFFFWLIVKLSRPYQTTRSVDFVFTLPEDKTFVIEPPQDMKVSLEGSGWSLIAELLSSRSIKVYYSLENASQLIRNRGQLRNDITAKLSSGELTILSMSHEDLNLELVDKDSKKVPIRLRYSFSYAQEFQSAGNPSLSHDSVVVTGPGSILADLNSWPTDSLVLANLKETRSLQIKLQAPPPELQLKPSEVILQLPVEQFTEKSFFVPVQVLDPPSEDSLRIFPEQIKLSLTVGLSNYDKVKPEDFTLVADWSGLVLAEGKNSIPVKLTQQSEFSKNVQLQRRSVEFYIVKKREEEEEDQ